MVPQLFFQATIWTKDDFCQLDSKKQTTLKVNQNKMISNASNEFGDVITEISHFILTSLCSIMTITSSFDFI